MHLVFIQNQAKNGYNTANYYVPDRFVEEMRTFYYNSRKYDDFSQNMLGHGDDAWMMP